MVAMATVTLRQWFTVYRFLQDLHFYKVVQSGNANVVDPSQNLLVQITLLNSNYLLIWTFGLFKFLHFWPDWRMSLFVLLGTTLATDWMTITFEYVDHTNYDWIFAIITLTSLSKIDLWVIWIQYWMSNNECYCLTTTFLFYDTQHKTHRQGLIYRDWTLTDTMLGYLDSCTSDLPFDLPCTLHSLILLYLGVSKYWIFSHFHWCFSRPNMMWIFVTISSGTFSPLFYWHFDNAMQSAMTLSYFFPITEIGSSWPYIMLTQLQSTFKLPHFHMMDHHPYIVTCHNLQP